MRESKTTLIIAEAGVNHNGDLQLAKELVDAAILAGADVIKFQTFQANQLATSYAQQALYQQVSFENPHGQLDMLQQLELSTAHHLELIDYCRVNNIEFLSTAFDLPSINLLSSFKLNRWKIPSGEITNLPYLRLVGSYKQPIILSTGMSNLGDIEAALNVFERAGVMRSLITVLHCTTEYPAPLDEVNLSAMRTISQAFDVAVGYSDHTAGIVVPIAAVAMGATVIEKHLTLDSTMPGPDHKASLEPDKFKEMVHGIRSIEQALGDGIKQPTSSEIPNLSVVRKSLVAARPIRAGELFTESNLTAKRPFTGISPMNWDKWIGRKASRDFMIDELIE